MIYDYQVVNRSVSVKMQCTLGCMYFIYLPLVITLSGSPLLLPNLGSPSLLPDLGLPCLYPIWVWFVVTWSRSVLSWSDFCQPCYMLLHGVGLPCQYLTWVFFILNWLAPLCRYAIWALLDIIVLTSPASSLLNLGPSCHYEICVLKYVPTS